MSKVILETMPDHLRASHRAARNWGVYPHNGAERTKMPRDEAERIIASDPDGYAHVVTPTKDPYRTVYHRDGSVSWWSVYSQSWHRTWTLPPDADLAAMSVAERKRIERHLGGHAR